MQLGQELAQHRGGIKPGCDGPLVLPADKPPPPALPHLPSRLDMQTPACIGPPSLLMQVVIHPAVAPKDADSMAAESYAAIASSLPPELVAPLYEE